MSKNKMYSVAKMNNELQKDSDLHSHTPLRNLYKHREAGGSDASGGGAVCAAAVH